MKKAIILLLTISLLVLLFPLATFAEKGDFYDKYKSRFDDANISDDYLDMVKVYDSETNSFECGTLDLQCKVQATSLVWATGLNNFVADATELLVLKPHLITEDRAFIRYKNYLKSLSNGMLILFIIWQIMMIVIRRFGDSDDYGQALNQKIILIFGSAILLGLYERIFAEILGIQNAVTSAILQSGLTRDELLLMVFIYTPEYSIFFSIFLGIINIIFAIALIYRFVALGFFYVVGPVAIPTMVNDEFNYFQIWLRYVVNNIVTLFMQSIAFVLAISAMTGQFTFTRNLPVGLDVVAGFLLSTVLCFFALVIPSILGNLGSSTGTGRALGRVARFAVMKK